MNSCQICGTFDQGVVLILYTIQKSKSFSRKLWHSRVIKSIITITSRNHITYFSKWNIDSCHWNFVLKGFWIWMRPKCTQRDYQSVSDCAKIADEVKLRSKLTVRITPRNKLVTMTNSYFKLTDSDDFLLWPWCIFIEISSHNVNIIGKCFEVVKTVFRTQISWKSMV